MSLLLIILLLIPQVAFAAQLGAEITYSIDQAAVLPGPYAATGDRSWMTFDADGAGPDPVAPHLLAIYVYANNQQVAAIIDDPGHRTTPYIGIDTTVNPRPKITLRAVWLRQPWRAATAYAVGDKISVFSRVVTTGGVIFPGIPNPVGYWECTRAGISGAAEPGWGGLQRIKLASGYRAFFNAHIVNMSGDVVDNGDGTVNMPSSSTSEFAAGDQVTISGSVNYNGSYILPAQTLADTGHIQLTHPYVAEALGSSAEIYLTAGEAVDNGDGTVTLPIPAHGFVAGDAVTIRFSDNYDGSYILPDQTLGDADHMVITAAFAGLPAAGSQASPTNGNVIDNGDGTVNLPTAGPHGLVAGDVIDISSTGNYNGSYTLPAQTLGDTTHIQLTAAWVAETIGPGEYFFKRVQDPDTNGVEWQYNLGSAVVVQSYPTGRIIVRDNGNGVAVKTGITYMRKAVP